MKRFFAVATLLVVCLLGFSTTAAAAPMAECSHHSVCNDTSRCYICGATGLEEGGTIIDKHVSVHCYDKALCDYCGKTLTEGETYETVNHDLEDENHIKFKVLDASMHAITCFCGEVEGDPIPHTTGCDAADLSVCQYCGCRTENINVFHTGEVMAYDEYDHWIQCKSCRKQVSPLLGHYTACTDPDGGCGYCGASASQITVKPDMRGFHVGEYDEAVEVDGVLHHRCYCFECGTMVLDHEGVVCTDFGSDETHSVACACGQWFDDMEHEFETVGKKPATCTEDGYTGDVRCKYCNRVEAAGSVVAASGHEFVNGKCAVCGALQNSGDKALAATGDEAANVSRVLIALAIVAAVVCAMSTVVFRRVSKPEDTLS